MKKIFMLALAGLSIFSFARLHAEQTVFVPEGQMTQYDRVVVTTHDGKEYVVGIDDQSTIHSYAGGNGYFIVDVIGTGSYYYSFRRDEIATLRFLESDEQIIIESLQQVEDDHSVMLRYDLGQLLVAPSAVGHTCYIRRVTGQTVRQFDIVKAGTVSLDDLPSGIYLITVKDWTLKIVKQ